MSDRSDELRRQRALLTEHLAWLDREIAAEGGIPRTAPLADAAPPPIAGPAFRPAPPVEARDADAILAEYSKPVASIASQTKRGCVLYFLAALALLAALVTGIYLFARARHGH